MEEDRPKNHYWVNRYREEKGRIRSVDTDDEVFVVGKGKRADVAILICL
jgi:hypothetical protein